MIYVSRRKKKSYLAEVQRLNKSSLASKEKKRKQQQTFKVPNVTKAVFIPKGILDESQTIICWFNS